MLAPQPFFRPRGTPVSIYHRIDALQGMGHRVDLITYPFGEDPDLEGLSILRTPRTPGVRDVPVGPSFAKAFLDVPFFFTALRALRRRSYDLVHTHEEACAFGAWFSQAFGVRHLYDMHSSLPQQFGNFDRFDRRPVVGAFRRLERYTFAHSDGVIAICDELAQHARRVGYTGPLAVIENTLAFERSPGAQEDLPPLRERMSTDEHRLVVYTGTFEEYQGLDLLVGAAERVVRARDDVRFVLVGGDERQIRELQELAREKGVEEAVWLVPRVPPERVPDYLELADVLVTPRRRGTNTPLKIYQYLRTGKPIVATDIRSHTQVLDSSCAELVPPAPAGLARGILRLLEEPRRADALGQEAARIACERYGRDAYLEALSDLLARITSSRDRRPEPATA